MCVCVGVFFVLILLFLKFEFWCFYRFFGCDCSDNTIEKKCPSAAKTAKISDWSSVSTDETEIAEVLASTGPLSVLLDANQLQFYNSGVWDGHLPSMPAILGCSKVWADLIRILNTCYSYSVCACIYAKFFCDSIVQEWMST